MLYLKQLPRTNECTGKINPLKYRHKLKNTGEYLQVPRELEFILASTAL